MDNKLTIRFEILENSANRKIQEYKGYKTASLMAIAFFVGGLVVGENAGASENLLIFYGVMMCLAIFPLLKFSDYIDGLKGHLDNLHKYYLDNNEEMFAMYKELIEFNVGQSFKEVLF